MQTLEPMYDVAVVALPRWTLMVVGCIVDGCGSPTGPPPASGHASAEIVTQGGCSFADLSTFRLSRFGNLAPRWREERGWLPHEPGLNHADAA